MDGVVTLQKYAMNVALDFQTNGRKEEQEENDALAAVSCVARGLKCAMIAASIFQIPRMGVEVPVVVGEENDARAAMCSVVGLRNCVVDVVSLSPKNGRSIDLFAGKNDALVSFYRR